MHQIQQSSKTVTNNSSVEDLSIQNAILWRGSVAWPCSSKLASKVSHTIEITACQLLRKLSKDLNVTGLYSLHARAGSDKSFRREDLLVILVTKEGQNDCKSPRPSPSSNRHVSPTAAAYQRDSKEGKMS